MTLIANGTLTHRMVKAAAILAERGIEARVLNMATVRPIDVEAVVSAARDTGRHPDSRGALDLRRPRLGDR